MHHFHQAVGSWVKSRCAGQVDAALSGQGVGKLRFELPALVGGDGLRTSVARYPSGQQGSGHRLRRDIQEGNGFWPLGETI
jgi:hypothetical protein